MFSVSSWLENYTEKHQILAQELVLVLSESVIVYVIYIIHDG